MTIEDFIQAVEAAEPGLLGTRGVSHEIVGGRVHLLTKDDPESGTEVWIYPNPDGTFTYERGDAREVTKTVNGVANAVFGNEPDDE